MFNHAQQIIRKSVEGKKSVVILMVKYEASIQNIYPMKFMFLSVFLLGLFAPVSMDVAKDGDDILGMWWTDDKRAKIEIYKKGNEYWGKIAWLKDPLNDEGKPVLDANNPDEEKAKKPVLGLNLISGFTYEKGKWVDGEIYDPDNGKTYSCVMKLKGERLEVRGYIGLTMFGRTVVWTQVK